MGEALKVQCPAGELIGISRKDGTPGCRCSIERNTLTAASDFAHLLAFCCSNGIDKPAAVEDEGRGGYQNCATWRAERDRIAEGRTAPLVPERQASL